MEALGQLAGGIAHELNNPLTSVTTYTKLLYEKLPEIQKIGGESFKNCEKHLSFIL